MEHEKLSWFDRCRSYRDQLIASPRVQRWVLANPLTRPIARRRARAMLDLCAGFVYSQVLFACVRLRLFDILFEQPLTTAALAERLSLSPEVTCRLLDAAVSLGLAERRGRSLYGLGQLGAALVGNRAALSLIEHQPLLYADLQDPVALLRGSSKGTGLARYWPYSAAAHPTELTAEEVTPYSALMAASQPLIAQEVLDSYPIHRRRCLLDVGGGEGVFLAAAATRAPALRLMLFDLPAVAERARTRLADAGLLERASIYGGNFLTDPLPEGADVISLIRIVHDHDDASALSLLRAVRRALPPKGTLLIAEVMSGVRGAESLDAYYGFYTLAMGRGEPRTVAEIGRLLRQAGFGRFRLLRNRMPILTSILIARPTSS
jgi:demethylspheroidene O-methyltransferase